MAKKILHIDSSPMGEKSFSKRISKEVVEGLKKKFPNSEVVSHDFAKNPLPHISAEVLGAFFTPVENQNEEQSKAIVVSDQLVNELVSADIIVVGAPMWNLNIPSSLKAWIDHIVRAGKTFKYTEQGPVGLLSSDKKVIIASSRGGMYTEGAYQAYDFQETYLKAIFGFLGVREIYFIRAEGTSMGESAIEAANKTAESQKEEVLAIV